MVLPAIVPRFLAAYPEIRLEVFAEDSFVDVLASGCDVNPRYDERLERHDRGTDRPASALRGSRLSRLRCGRPGIHVTSSAMPVY